MSEARYHLYIVDDDPLQLSLAREAAENSGVFGKVSTAADGAEAWVQLPKLSESKAALPDIILSDLKMPQMDGIQLTREIKSHPALREIPVVIHTSSDLPDDRRRAFAAGCAHFISKSASFQGLQKTIESLPGLCGLTAK
jgi:CheY-like chemotaxis protein